jgi:hypothetical protein
MGLLDRLGLSTKRVQALSTPTQITALYSDPGQLGTIVISEALGAQLANLPMDHGTALTVPPVEDAVGLLTSSVARYPLVALDSQNNPVANQPTWLSWTDPDTDVHERMVSTVEDIIMFGNAIWLVKRGSDGFILAAVYCPRDMWHDRDGRIYVEGRDVPLEPLEFILFNPRFRGLLNIASRNLRGAIDVERAWHRQARNPIPLMVLQMSEEGLEPDEIDQFVQKFADSRNTENGAVGYLPPGVEMKTFGETDPALMTTGRNATKNDISSYLGIPASMLDGTVNEASLTYTTAEGNRNRFYDFALPRWMDPISARLSRDDVVPHGQHVAFDMTAAYTTLPAPTGPTLKD